MDENTRLEGLKALCAKLGGPSAAARTLGYDAPSFISQMLNCVRPITEKTARRIERKVGLPFGWMASTHATIEDLERREKAAGRSGWFHVPEDNVDAPKRVAPGANSGAPAPIDSDCDLPLQGMMLATQRSRELGIKLPASAMFQVASTVTGLLESQRASPDAAVVDALLTLAQNLSHG